jgi:beta-adrenergic-receptor kinase
MEELQDAIEDAQYVTAIAAQEDGPRPVLPWNLPNAEQLGAWQRTVRKRDGPEAFSIEWTMSSRIGFFLFSSFVKQRRNDYTRMNFCEQVVRFKAMQGRPRLEQARHIVADFLSPRCDDPEKPGFLREPPRTEINEYSLEREKTKVGASRLSELIEAYLDYPICSETCIGVKGSVRKQIYTELVELERTERNLTLPASLPTTLIVPETSKVLLGNGGDDQHSEITADYSANNVEKSKLTVSNLSGEGGPTNNDIVKSNESATQSLATRQSKTDSIISLASSASDISSMRDLTHRFRSNSQKNISRHMFDEADAIVMESLKRDYWDQFVASEEFLKLQNFLWYQDRRVMPEDFFVMRVLGRGGFGLVTACKKGTSGKLYAMKVMNKRRIKMKKSEQLALNERYALAAVESNFVVNLKYSFQSKDEVYLILDLMTGGDLGFLLHQRGRFPKRECQYYTARIMLGLQALHDKTYVYRDLKPENCLLADDGRVKITDLGLAIKVTPDLHGAAGTRGYWAPEMLRRDKKGKRKPYGHSVDWFSFGCCVAEFISGSNPFRSEAALNFGLDSGKQTKEEAIDYATLEMDPQFPDDKFEPEAADLCSRLLDKNEKTRLGSSGCEEIMAHPWFKNMNWEAIISDRKRPPFVPAKDVNAASQSEIGNFVEDKAYQAMVITEEDENVYKYWDWTNPHAFAAEVIEFLIYERKTGEPLVPTNHSATCCCTLL